ncbi:NAD(P)H-dependent oxidoreductase [Candidatus Woesearchaeota archaeon]|nr:NAD(P)H-dependent oxidoreductase [Candidatus Woesearchaeota archaeon]
MNKPKKNKKPKSAKAKKTFAPGKQANSKKSKKLVVFYSRTGITRKVANAIAQELQAELEELVDKKSRKGIMGWLSGGRDAMKKILTELEPLEKDLSEYEIIVIGTPIWAGNMAPAARTFLSQNRGKLKKVAFFHTRGGSGLEKVEKELWQALSATAASATVAAKSLALLRREVVKDLHADKVKEFAKQLIG